MVGIGNFEEMKEDNDGDSTQTGVGDSHANSQLLECNDLMFFHPSDTSGTALVPQLLAGTENYSEWSRSIKMSFLVKNKIGFIDGTCTREKYEADPFKLHQWDRCNAIVQSWIMSSVAQDLRKGIVYSSNAQKVWEAFKERFDKVNATKILMMLDKNRGSTIIEMANMAESTAMRLLIWQDLFSGKVKGIGSEKNGLYILNPYTPVAAPVSKCLSSSLRNNSNVLWHQRLGHAPQNVLLKIPTIRNHLSKSTDYGSVERFKARLVTKGYTQLEGLDFHDTFSHVAKLTTVRTIVVAVALKGWPIFQMDVHNAFLNGDLEEEVYMSLPQGFSSQGEHKVCRLLKSLYGLKQASKQWNSKLTQALIESGNDLEEIQNAKAALHQKFKLKDVGELRYFLGIEFARSKEGILMSKRKYALEMIPDVG
uniref:Uncharacterized protein LOC104228907 n=1 Tax=Nicotiana sylvestris TaxID=4096 RepID=A0A1U7WMF1_NICSY|nr:PREDICTED: uncharacterized protein LOC104228907 [Nicotiana sylvestris]